MPQTLHHPSEATWQHSTRYPSHRCDEHDGRGWEAVIISATGRSAVVRYAHAVTRDGRAYQDTREPFEELEALD